MVLDPHPERTANPGEVYIILAHYNGETFLAQQLQSIVGQTYEKLRICISDDGSDPSSIKKLNALPIWSDKRIHIKQYQTNVGVTQNFLRSIADADKTCPFFAFSDQDDIWHGEKLARAVSFLAKEQLETPALYCSRTEITDITGQNHLGFSPLFSKPASFSNALMQCIGGGNTMVFNNSARNLIVEASKDVDVVSHDWWAYLVVAGAGGRVYYDPLPSLKYRQHGGNLSGSNASVFARLKRAGMMLNGVFRDWNSINTKALLAKDYLLTAENREVLHLFIEARNAPFLTRMRGLKKAGVHRQTLPDNVGLFVAKLLKKV